MTKKEAFKLVEKLLNKGNAADNTDLIVDESNISDIGTHWIIPVQSKKYLESGDDAYAVIGINHYAIRKSTCKIDHSFDTSNFSFFEE